MSRFVILMGICLVFQVSTIGCAASPALWQTQGMNQAQKTIANKEDVFRLPASDRPQKDRAKSVQAWKILSAYNGNVSDNSWKLHVVYLTFEDVAAPFPDYRERYDRILKNIQLYYADQMKACGFPPLTFPLELDESGKVVIHEAHVNRPLKEMNAETIHVQTIESASKALAEKGIEFKKSFVVMVCPHTELGDFVCGTGFFASGNAWICDQPGLDPLRFQSNEHYGGYYNNTYGKNASVYIGTLAHELGHMFHLRHSNEGWEYAQIGRSLMGSGNYTYGDDLRADGPGTFLNPADALQLAAHPLFYEKTGNDFQNTLTCDYDNITLEAVKDGATIRGTLKTAGQIPCYGIVAYCDPYPVGPKNDYDANTTTAIPDEEGRFCFTLIRPGYEGYFRLTLLALFANGQKVTRSYHAALTKEGFSCLQLEEEMYFREVARLWQEGRLDEASSALNEVFAHHGQVRVVQERGKAWKAAVLKTIHFRGKVEHAPEERREISLVEHQPDRYETGFGGLPRWNALLPSELGPLPVFPRGTIHDRFIMLHAAGLLEYTPDRKWKRLKMDAGVPIGRDGSIRIRVRGDRHTLYTSRMLHEGQTVTIDADIEDVEKLFIDILDGDNGITLDWAILINPILTR